MKKLIRESAGGKTTKLVKESAETGYYIVCFDKKEVKNVIMLARHLNLSIPYPITHDEFLEGGYSGKKIKGFLIDDADRLLDSITTIKIQTISMQP